MLAARAGDGKPKTVREPGLQRIGLDLLTSNIHLPTNILWRSTPRTASASRPRANDHAIRHR